MNHQTHSRSPLDQIRDAEAEINRRIAEAHRAAEEQLRTAESQAGQIKQEARRVGSSEGQARYQERIASVEIETQRIIYDARCRAEQIERQGQVFLPEAVRLAIALIAGVEVEEVAE
jgi:flagellar biosynthesis/type III secretory pathway protein FliH